MKKTVLVILFVTLIFTSSCGFASNSPVGSETTLSSTDSEEQVTPEEEASAIPDIVEEENEDNNDEASSTGSTEVVTDNFIFYMPDGEGFKNTHDLSEDENTFVKYERSSSQEFYARYAGKMVTDEQFDSAMESQIDISQKVDHDVIHIKNITIDVYSGKTYGAAVDYKPKAGETPINEVKLVYISAPNLNDGELVPALNCSIRYASSPDCYKYFNQLLDYIIANVELR